MITLIGCSDGPVNDGTATPNSFQNISKGELSGSPFDMSSGFSGLCQFKSKTLKREFNNGEFTFIQTTVVGRPTLIITCTDSEDSTHSYSLYINNYTIENNLISSENGFRGEIGHKALIGNITFEGYYINLKTRFTSDTTIAMTLHGYYGYTPVYEISGEMSR